MIKRTSLRARAFALASVAVLAACARPAAQAPQPPRPAEPPKGAVAMPAMDLGGQRVLILPVQTASGLNVSREKATAEVVFALGERDTRTVWITPDQLRASMRRIPNYAPDPATLPPGAFQHRGERYIIGELAMRVRRYTSLMDARLALVIRDARWIPAPDGATGMVRISAAMVDSRNGTVVWYGEADGEPRPLPDDAAVATAAAALAARMVVESSQ
ncbi:MAG TPA: hypothetical protein VE871_15945 [Longimicrobium sp.]|nr:hypothetical protein [Longimicrobium sp.]